MPRAGTHVGNVVTTTNGGQVSLEWEGQKIIEQIRNVELVALHRVEERAKAYWDSAEWTPGHHPYMTGNEESIKANGYFVVGFNENGTASLMFGSDSEHTVFEELGTSRQPAHHPIRNTVDHVAYSIADELRRASREAGL